MQILLCCSGLLMLWPRVTTSPFQGDESGWISSGRYYTRLVLHGDLDRARWDCDGCGPWGGLNPHLGKVLVGAPLALTAILPRVSVFSAYYDFDASHEENVTRRLVPPDDVLTRARWGSVVFGLVCLLVVFSVGRRAFGPWAGLAGAFLLLGNRTFLLHATTAMTDAHYNAFLLCTCLSAIVVLKARSRNALALSVVLLGFLAGLAGSVKITGLPLGVLLFAAVLAYRSVLLQEPWRRAVALVALMLSSGLVTVYALNPCFWPSAAAFDLSAAAREASSMDFDTAVTQIERADDADENPAFANLTRPLRFPFQFLRWKHYMERQRDLFSAGWGTSRQRAIHQQLPLLTSRPYVGWILLGFGVFVGARQIAAGRRTREPAHAFVLLAWFAINYLFILAFLELNWERYYLPAMVAQAPLVGAGIVEALALSGRVGRALGARVH